MVMRFLTVRRAILIREEYSTWLVFPERTLRPKVSLNDQKLISFGSPATSVSTWDRSNV